MNYWYKKKITTGKRVFLVFASKKRYVIYEATRSSPGLLQTLKTHDIATTNIDVIVTRN